MHAGFAPGLAELYGIGGALMGGFGLLGFEVVMLAVEGFAGSGKGFNAGVLAALR